MRRRRIRKQIQEWDLEKACCAITTCGNTKCAKHVNSVLNRIGYVEIAAPQWNCPFFRMVAEYEIQHNSSNIRG